MDKAQLEVLNTMHSVLKCIVVSLVIDEPPEKAARVAGMLKHFAEQSRLPHVQAMLEALAEDCATVAVTAKTASAAETTGH